MKHLTFLLALTICFFSTQAQQGNIWYFGEGLGLDFNTGSPTILTDGLIQGYPQNENENLYSEGSSSISDSNGDLLFYSNGEKVWDKNHDLMPNGDGLVGMYSSTHPALIVPRPSSDSLFYIFTTDGLERDLENGLCYSVVDMCLNDGLGDVVASQKNINLIDVASEKITAVRHSNGTDYWIVGHEYDSDAFYVFPLTENGVGNPSTYNIGSIHQGNGFFAAIGQMKASPDGTKIALVFSNVNPSVIEIFDFDPSTGAISNVMALDQNSNEYGIEFSPDNTKLYITNLSGVFQFDLIAGNGEEDDINASKTNISTLGCIPSGLQLGPDNKIYVNRCNTYIDVINQPNELGELCDLEEGAIEFGTLAVSSFPSFVAGYAYTNELVNCRTVGIHEIDLALVQVFPNPTDKILNIRISDELKGEASYSVYDISGKMIISNQLIFSNNTSLDVTNIDSGIYFAHLIIGSKLAKIKFLVN